MKATETLEEYYAERHTAKITVTEPCSCWSCKAGRRWFQCVDPIIIATYNCEPFDGIAAAPSSEAVAEIEALHPGKDLRYIKLF